MTIGTSKVWFDGTNHLWRFVIQFMDNKPCGREHVVWPNLNNPNKTFHRMDDAKQASDVVLKEFGFNIIKSKHLAML